MIKLTHLLIALSLPATMGCSNPDEQADLREGTVVIEEPRSVVNVDDYPFIDQTVNSINLNGDDWSSLRNKFMNTDSSSVSIIHIGDSHIQADVSSDRTRNHFWEKYGSGGRGLITPLKICGTNEPNNYKFTTTARVTTAKLMKLPWLTDMGFTGTAFTPRSLKYTVSLSTEVTQKPDGEPFQCVKLLANGSVYIDRITDGLGHDISFKTERDEDHTIINLSHPVTSVDINMHSFEPVTFFGAVLYGNDKGVLYHAIGNNGATYASYNRLGSMGRDVAELSPDLAIISLGTNEAFGKVDDESLYAEIDYLVKDLRKHNPGIKILLTTPKECQRSARVVRRNRRTGRRVYSTSKNYSVNENIKRLRNVIIEYGKRNSVPVYDWYAVAGGDGASEKWIEAGLMSKDRIHNTYAGYEITGDLIFDALEKAIYNSNKK